MWSSKIDKVSGPKWARSYQRWVDAVTRTTVLNRLGVIVVLIGSEEATELTMRCRDEGVLFVRDPNHARQKKVL